MRHPPLSLLATAVALVTGCTEPTWYPRLFDTGPHPGGGGGGGGDDTSTSGIPCSEDSILTTAVLEIENRAYDVLYFYWRAPDCTETLYNYAYLDKPISQSTYVGNVWVLRTEAGEYVDHYVVESADPPAWIVE